MNTINRAEHDKSVFYIEVLPFFRRCTLKLQKLRHLMPMLFLQPHAGTLRKVISIGDITAAAESPASPVPIPAPSPAIVYIKSLNIISKNPIYVGKDIFSNIHSSCISFFNSHSYYIRRSINSLSVPPGASVYYGKRLKSQV